jgi:hypothetical protein
MHSSFVSPRQVKIGDAAAFAGTTPRAIRHYHEIGLLPEPERGGNGAGSCRREAGSMSVLEAAGKMPYDFSPARLRCFELATQLSVQDAPVT